MGALFDDLGSEDGTQFCFFRKEGGAMVQCIQFQERKWRPQFCLFREDGGAVSVVSENSSSHCPPFFLDKQGTEERRLKVAVWSALPSGWFSQWHGVSGARRWTSVFLFREDGGAVSVVSEQSSSHCFPSFLDRQGTEEVGQEGSLRRWLVARWST